MRILSTSKQKEKGGDGQKGGLTESYLLVWLVTVAGFTDPQDLPSSSLPFPSTIWTKYIVNQLKWDQNLNNNDEIPSGNPIRISTHSRGWMQRRSSWSFFLQPHWSRRSCPGRSNKWKNLESCFQRHIEKDKYKRNNNTGWHLVDRIVVGMVVRLDWPTFSRSKAASTTFTFTWEAGEATREGEFLLIQVIFLTGTPLKS